MSEVPKSEDEEYDPENDPRTMDQLIADALDEMVRSDEGEEIEPYSARYVICRRCNETTLQTGKDLLHDAEPNRRRLGAGILGNIGIFVDRNPNSDDLLERVRTFVRPFRDKSVEYLINALESEADPNVLCSIGIALGHIGDLHPIEALVKLKNHPHEDVRYGVVHGLLEQTDEGAIQALIELSQDEDTDVRDWATCGLGSLLYEEDTLIDTPEIRAALYRNIDDPDEVTHYEAIAGLLKRRVHEIVPRVLDEISSGNVVLGSAYGFGGDFVEMLYVLRDEIDDPRLGPIIEQALELYPWLTTFDDDNP